MTNISKIQAYTNLYKKTLLDNVIPFWKNNSLDWEHGGYLTCLDETGQVYDTDKFIWLQARQVWTFSMLYNRVEKKQEWLDIAKNGIDFLIKHGQDKNGNFYFSLTQKGEALTHAFNIYADCFAALAFGEFAKATDDKKILELSRQSYFRFLERRKNPKGQFEKTTGVRPIKAFGLPMMTAYLTAELSDFTSSEKKQELFENCIYEILNVHYNPDAKVIYEHVDLNDQFIDTYEGRLINPGHGIEAMWFLMDVALHMKRPNLIDRATDICLEILEYGWDKKHGGIFYFMDVKGAPLQQLEWDQKLWWVHQEALIALSKAYQLTRREDVWNWYQKVHDYSWKHFSDPNHGEWYGYLNRQGQPHTTLKGGKWKGCFHTPRAMYECWQNFQVIVDEENQLLKQ